VKQRVLPQDDVEQWDERIKSMSKDIISILLEEKEEMLVNRCLIVQLLSDPKGRNGSK